VKIVALLRSVDEVGGAGERDAQRCSFESGQAVRSSSWPQTTDTGTWPASVTGQVVAVRPVGAVDVAAPWVGGNDVWPGAE